MRPLLIVDGDNLAHRAYHSTPKTVRGTGGRPVNAIVGFFGMLGRIASEELPRGIFVAWDTLGVDTYRSELWPPYQTGRIFDREIVEQLEVLPEVCRAFGFGIGKAAGFEADDLMAAAALAVTKAGGHALVLTTDRDAYQLASDHVTILAPRRGTRELDRIGPEAVVGRLGVLPDQVPDYKALCGDPSDRIPGVRGIGPKSAAELLLRGGDLDSVVASWPQEQRELALRFREVVRMRPEVTVDLPAAAPDWQAGAAALRALGADGIADRISALFQAVTPGGAPDR